MTPEKQETLLSSHPFYRGERRGFETKNPQHQSPGSSEQQKGVCFGYLLLRVRAEGRPALTTTVHLPVQTTLGMRDRLIPTLTLLRLAHQLGELGPDDRRRDQRKEEQSVPCRNIGQETAIKEGCPDISRAPAHSPGGTDVGRRRTSSLPTLLNESFAPTSTSV